MAMCCLLTSLAYSPVEGCILHSAAYSQWRGGVYSQWRGGWVQTLWLGGPIMGSAIPEPEQPAAAAGGKTLTPGQAEVEAHRTRVGGAVM